MIVLLIVAAVLIGITAALVTFGQWWVERRLLPILIDLGYCLPCLRVSLAEYDGLRARMLYGAAGALFAIYSKESRIRVFEVAVQETLRMRPELDEYFHRANRCPKIAETPPSMTGECNCQGCRTYDRAQ